MELVSQQWQLELTWARLLRERIVAVQPRSYAENPCIRSNSLTIIRE
jgi:hypothetical protein